MKLWIIVTLAFVAACSGSPTAPTPPPVQVINNVPPVAVTPPEPPAPATPSVPIDGRYDRAFYLDFVLGLFQDNTVYTLMRLPAAPRLFLNTHDDRGQPIDAITLDTVAAAMINVAATWGGGQFGLAGLELGTGTRAGQRGWLTVVWSTGNSSRCGLSNGGQDGGVITFYRRNNCGCNGSAIMPSIAKHELGHAFGYFHTRNDTDIMSPNASRICDYNPSAREVYHASVAYSRPIGSPAP